MSHPGLDHSLDHSVVGEFPSPRATTRLLTEALAEGRITMDEFIVAMDEMIELAEFMTELERGAQAPLFPPPPPLPPVGIDRLRRLLERLEGPAL